MIYKGINRALACAWNILAFPVLLRIRSAGRFLPGVQDPLSESCTVKSLLLRRLLTIALLLVQGSLLVHAQIDEAKSPGITVSNSLFDFFYRHQDTLPVLRIDTDWGRLIRAKQKEEYQPGVLSYFQGNGQATSLNIELRARGNTRKKVCLFPPIKAKILKQNSEKPDFNPEFKLKLVLPCQGGKNNEDCLLREALAYKLYEKVHPIHFRTRLIELQCWQDGREKHTFLAFLVEEEEEMAARLDGRLLSKGKIRPDALERSLYVRLCFFQYMIANTDWSVASRHNLRFLQLPGFQRVVPVPYDFDYAGLVNTSYAIPGSTIPIENVSERYFMCKDVTEEEAQECTAFFLAQKEQILKECSFSGLLKERSANSIQDFLSDFFDTLENDELMRRMFVKAQNVD